MFLTEAVIKDETDSIKAIWFNQPFLLKTLKPKTKVNLSGKIVLGKGSTFLSNPVYEIIRGNLDAFDTTHTGRLVPIYPETQGLSSRWLRYCIKLFLPLVKNIKDFLPEEIKNAKKLLDITKAIKEMHFPSTKELAAKSKRRLAFDELFLIQLVSLKARQKIKKEKSYAFPLNIELAKQFTNSLPFKLTNAQRKAAWEIIQDIAKPVPMSRLLNGDVGSGKTVVAAMASLFSAKAGYQTAFMAPTEILAKQHFETISKILKNFNIKIGLLTGSEARIANSDTNLTTNIRNNKFGKVSDKKLVNRTAEGFIDILIGTHSLIQKRVKFKNLALVVIDEQHRFGVNQRGALVRGNTQNPTQKNAEFQRNSASSSASFSEQMRIPHLLSMTATPIPRTLALTIYGDLDISILDEMPSGRQKIITKLVAPTNREKAYKFIKEQIQNGRQIFVICPLIEDSIKLEVKSVRQEYDKLSKKVFPDLKIGILHGRLKPKEKEEVMKKLNKGEIDILVSTSVVEVGIDIPNASVMMIEGSERFGLAQLHQFRGRVGRGQYQSYCFLFTDSPSKKTNERLKMLLECGNGFHLAEKDLEIRGPGDFLGTKQWGLPDLAMASLTDLSLIKETKEEAEKILKKDPELKNYPALYEKLNNFKKLIHPE